MQLCQPHWLTVQLLHCRQHLLMLLLPPLALAAEQVEQPGVVISRQELLGVPALQLGRCCCGQLPGPAAAPTSASAPSAWLHPATGTLLCWRAELLLLQVPPGTGTKGPRLLACSACVMCTSCRMCELCDLRLAERSAPEPLHVTAGGLGQQAARLHVQEQALGCHRSRRVWPLCWWEMLRIASDKLWLRPAL